MSTWGYYSHGSLVYSDMITFFINYYQSQLQLPWDFTWENPYTHSYSCLEAYVIVIKTSQLLYVFTI